MAVRLSALRAGRPLPPGRFLVRAAGRVRSTEKSNDLIGNRTRDIPACSIVPQPIMLPGTPYHFTIYYKLFSYCRMEVRLFLKQRCYFKLYSKWCIRRFICRAYRKKGVNKGTVRYKLSDYNFCDPSVRGNQKKFGSIFLTNYRKKK
jgi:hypothetical protein